jgi:hypothetical protein
MAHGIFFCVIFVFLHMVDRQTMKQMKFISVAYDTLAHWKEVIEFFFVTDPTLKSSKENYIEGVKV